MKVKVLFAQALAKKTCSICSLLSNKSIIIMTNTNQGKRAKSKKLMIADLLVSTFNGFLLDDPQSNSKRTFDDLLDMNEERIEKVMLWFKENANLDISSQESVVLAILYYSEETGTSAGKETSYEALGKLFGLKQNLALLTLNQAINCLLRRGIIHITSKNPLRNRSARGFSAFTIDDQWLLWLADNKKVAIPADPPLKNNTQFIRRANSIFQNLKYNAPGYTYAIRNYIQLFQNNLELPIVNKLVELFGPVNFGDDLDNNIEFQNDFELELTNAIQSLICCNLLSHFITRKAEYDLMENLEDLPGNLSQTYVESFENECNPLLIEGLVEIKPSAQKMNFSIILHPTPRLFKELYPDSEAFNVESMYHLTKVTTDKTKLQDLIYPENVQQDLLLVEKLVKGNNNLSAFIHGSPGVGKTSYILRLAEQTNAIVLAPSGDILSKWFGQSESNLKMMFNEYRDIRKKTEKPVILFIDEADGLLAKRMENNSDNSVIGTLNTLQTILLKEIENFDGVLICCSNFNLSHFDPAYHRRFDFQIEISTTPDQLQHMLRERGKEHNIELPDSLIKQISLTPKITPAMIDLALNRISLLKKAGMQPDFSYEINRISANSSTQLKTIKGFSN
jgi:Holliday junction resolvasome RuvABC ATP-dependent DNA helicase subunit